MALKRVGDDILSRNILILSDETPSLLTQVPVHNGEGDEVLKALELSGDQSAVRLVTHAIRVNSTET